jgi:hypothetical protein
MRLKALPLCVLGTLLIVLSCGQEKATSVGADFYDQENPVEENRLVLPAVRDTVYSQTVSCGTGYYLFTGTRDGVETRSFFVFDTVTVAGTVDRAVLSFRTIPYAAPASGGGDVRLVLSPTASDWDEDGVSWDNQPAETGASFAEASAAASDTTDVEVEIPLDLALSLVNPDTAAARPGVALRAGDPDCVLRLFAREAGVTTSPTLLFIVSGDTTDTVSVQTVRDAFVVRNGTAVPPERLRIQDGTAERILLFFDLSSIPREATINRARLVLHADDENVFPASDPDFSFSVYPVSDSSWTVPPTVLDSSRAVTGAFSGDSTATVITAIVQRWTSGLLDNAGLMIKGSLETTVPAGCSPFSGATPDAGLAPRLDVYYSLPPTSRF